MYVLLATLVSLSGARCASASEDVVPAAEKTDVADLTALPLEQLLALQVFSASKFMQKTSEAPSSVTVISAADIRAFGWHTLADVLRTVRGLYVSNDRNYSYLGARGFLRPGDYNTRFLLQIDGNRINDAVYDQAPMGAEFPLDLELVERIEYVAGPGSSIYGANAFFGVINIITRRPQDMEGTRAVVEGGQAGGRRAVATYGWHDGSGNDLLLSASRAKTDGRDQYYAEYAAPDGSGGVAHGLDYETTRRLFARGSAGPLTLSLVHAERDKGVPTASFDQAFDDPRSRTIDRQTYADLAYHAAPSTTAELALRLYWGQYDSLGDYPTGVPDAILNRDLSTSRWWGAEMTLLSTAIAGHKLLAGAEFQDDYRLRMVNYDIEPYLEYLNQNHDGKRYGVYLQDEVALGPSLLLNAGLRYDHHASTGGVFNPRLALVRQAGAGTTLKAMYGSAYRAPNNYELYYTFPGPGGQAANPLLGRERIRSSELALIRQLAGNARLTVSVFRNDVSALISQRDVAGIPTFVNDGHSAARGAEIEYERSWNSLTRLRASVSWQRASQDSGDSINSPARLAKLNLALPLAGAWRAGIEAQYVSRRDTVQGGSTGSYLLANLNLYSVRLTRHVDLALTASNLFDRRYADPVSAAHLQPAIAQDGRLLRAQFSYAY